jgi:hypothetical protein
MSEAIAWNVLKEQYYSCKEYSYLKVKFLVNMPYILANTKDQV